MPVINIPMPEGSTTAVNVDDGYANLSEADQATFRDTLRRNLLAATAPPDTSFSGAIRHGLFEAAHGLGRTVADLGAPETGNAISNAVSDAPDYQTAISGLGNAIKAGKWLDAAEYLPRAIVENAPDLAGAAGAGLVGSVAGPVGGRWVWCIYSGPNIRRQRGCKCSRSEPGHTEHG
jgi:hypothetical protein